MENRGLADNFRKIGFVYQPSMGISWGDLDGATYWLEKGYPLGREAMSRELVNLIDVDFISRYASGNRYDDKTLHSLVYSFIECKKMDLLRGLLTVYTGRKLPKIFHLNHSYRRRWEEGANFLWEQMKSRAQRLVFGILDTLEAVLTDRAEVLAWALSNG